MTQTQFVEYQHQGFWAYDVALGVFLKHLIDVAEERVSADGIAWLADAIQSWRVVACVSDYGLFIPEDWSAQQIATLSELSLEACRRIEQRESFDADEMKAWSILEGRGVFSRGATELAARPIVELGEAIVALVAGDLPAAPKGTVWIYGTSQGRRTLPMRE